jgi:hypothetical protein
MGYVRVHRLCLEGGGGGGIGFGSNDWTQLGQTIYGNVTEDQSGLSVDVTPNGTVLAIGSPRIYGNDDRPGYVRVYSLEDDDGNLGAVSWEQLGQDIVGEVVGDGFGVCVSISEDGKTIAVGADTSNGNGEDSGSVRIFRLDDNRTRWEQLGHDINGEAAWDNLGASVSLSWDGGMVAIGSMYNLENGTDSGQVRVYHINSVGWLWERLGQIIYGDRADVYAGWSVDISPSGDTLAVGYPGKYDKHDRRGYVRVYNYLDGGGCGPVSGIWKQTGREIAGKANGDEFGVSVSLSLDGRTLAVGAQGNNGRSGENLGQVRVYQLDDSGMTWTLIGKEINEEAAHDLSGRFVSLSADVDTVVIGSPWNDEKEDYAGQVRVFAME